MNRSSLSLKLLKAASIFYRLAEGEQDINQGISEDAISESDVLEQYDVLQKKIDYVQPLFEAKLKKAISKSTDISKVNIVIDRKSYESILEKHHRKGRDIGTFSDLLRAAVLIDRKTDPMKIIDGLKYYFDIIKIDEKIPTKEKAYGNAIHVDILIEGFVCEVQIMSNTLWRYKQVADKVYKNPNLPNTDQDKWFERGRFVENIKKDIPKKEDFDIEEFASSILKLKK